jgi:hypothetical protein
MRALPLATAALSAAVALSGCSVLGSSDADAPAVTAAPTTTAPGAAAAGTAFAGKKPADILALSRKAVSAATSVHIKGSVTDGGETTKLDLILTARGESAGTVGIGGHVLTLRRSGTTTYVMADARFWKSQGVGKGTGLGAGRWLKVPANTPGFTQFDAFTNMSTFFTALLEPDPGTTLTQVAGKSTRGKQTVGLLDRGTDGGTLYISTDEAKPLPLAVVPLPNEGAAGDKVLFYDWDAPVTVVAPPAKSLVDVATLTGS